MESLRSPQSAALAFKRLFREIMNKRIIIVWAISLMAASVQADINSHNKTAIELLEIFEYEVAISVAQKQPRHLAMEILAIYPCKEKITMAQEMESFLVKRFNTQKIKNEYINLYTENLSESEILRIVDYLKVNQIKPSRKTKIEKSDVGEKASNLLPKLLVSGREIWKKYASSLPSQSESFDVIAKYLTPHQTCKNI